MKAAAMTARPTVAIVGAGFGGLTAARKLAHAPVDVVVIDRRNHHVFQPLLYQVATAALTPSQIASPIRTILRRQRNAHVVLGEVSGVDLERREVRLPDRLQPYDYLVIATGATHAYFGHEEWSQDAPGLKTLEDATGVRRRVLLAFERAELERDPVEQRRLLTFVVVGGGATGVEMAGAIAELAKRALASDFKHIRTAMARVVLVEAGPRVLPVFSERLSAYARRALEKLGVEVQVGKAVSGVDDRGVDLGPDRLEACTVVWAAGVRASPVARWIGAPADRAGRVHVQPDLSVEGHPEVFVIGDAALVLDDQGRPVPGVAPSAKQEGAFVGKLITAEVEGADRPARFRYRDQGMLATVGRKSAVVVLGGVEVTGLLAWLLWSAAHIYFLIGFRNRLVVTIDWLWSYFTFERGSRLITGDMPPPDAPLSDAAPLRTSELA
jgi:NADH:quinone reductase (non-electrogenic)